MKNAVDKGKVLAISVKEKVTEMDLGNKVKSTGTMALEKMKVASEKVKEKGNEAMVALYIKKAIFYSAKHEKESK